MVMVDEITEGFEDFQLDHPTGEGETRLGYALKTPCLWWKGFIKLPNWTPPPPPPLASQGTPPPPPPPPPASDDQGTQPPSPARGGTPPPSPPAPACLSSQQPPPCPPRQQGQKRPAVAPAAPACRSPSPPPRKQARKKTGATAAPSTLASSSTARRGGRQCRYGPPLKPLEKLPYERTEEENATIVRTHVKDFFEGVKAKRHPPLEEKVDPVKAKRTRCPEETGKVSAENQL